MEAQPKVKPVKLTRSIFGRQESERFDTLREALETVRVEVEENLAAPVSIEMSASVFGGGVVKFTTLQIYLMAQLVEPVEA